MLKTHARHYLTNEPIPDDLLARLMKARRFNEGFATIEYTASALFGRQLPSFLLSSTLTSPSPLALDTAIHQLKIGREGKVDIPSFEKSTLERLGMPSGMIMRHRPAHFQREWKEAYLFIPVDDHLHTCTQTSSPAGVTLRPTTSISGRRSSMQVRVRVRVTSATFSLIVYFPWEDGFDAFLETGDCFNREVAQRLRKYIYSSGNSLDPAEAFRLFRGR